ncbi:MAG: TRAP transporter substrate-binding protein DctP [Ignavibacteriales bacterium]|nr:TRAP transporter substrate-binding protein DctP [Ignavibacteriales bacterium]
MRKDPTREDTLSLLRPLCLAVLVAVVPVCVAQQYTIKFATLATGWDDVDERDARVRCRPSARRAAGGWGSRLYAGGVQGEDKDVMRKIRLGQLHSAGYHGRGRRARSPPSCASSMRRSCSRTTTEVDNFHEDVRRQSWTQEFEKNDFVLLGWAEVGFVYVLTNTPVRSVADMNGVKMWRLGR